MNILKYKKIFLAVSGSLVVGSVLAIGFWGLNLGIDFTGGTLLEAEFEGVAPSADSVKEELGKIEGLGRLTIQPVGEQGIIVRMRHIDEGTHQAILESLLGLEPFSEKRFVAIGPVVGTELARKSLIALAVALFAIILYISWAFRKVSEPVSSWKYGVVAILALIHDSVVPTGIFAFLGRFYGVEIDVFFVTALLTIVGFSVHDTIVVFDRIRENLKNLKVAEPFEITVGRSVKETITRSVNTSLTTLLVVAAILIFGSEGIRFFALALGLGIIFGTYSSIFVAAPLLAAWDGLTRGE